MCGAACRCTIAWEFVARRTFAEVLSHLRGDRRALRAAVGHVRRKKEIKERRGGGGAWKSKRGNGARKAHGGGLRRAVGRLRCTHVAWNRTSGAGSFHPFPPRLGANHANWPHPNRPHSPERTLVVAELAPGLAPSLSLARSRTLSDNRAVLLGSLCCSRTSPRTGSAESTSRRSTSTARRLTTAAAAAAARTVLVQAVSANAS